MSRHIFWALSVPCGLTALLYGQSLMERGLPRVYEGKNLEAVLMPIGGIGTGNVWIAGSGELAEWQIFSNSLARIGLGDTFLAMRAKAQGERPVVRALQTVPREAFPPMEALAAEYGCRLWVRSPSVTWRRFSVATRSVKPAD